MKGIDMKRKTRYLAGISLGVMGTGFASSLFLQNSAAGRILLGGFEGGLVGGLADWFAVTALFRHPLGLPIPHTALVVKNRQRITDQILRVLEQEWLSKESILEKIQEVSVVGMILSALEQEKTRALLRSTVSTAVLHILQTLDPLPIAEWIEQRCKGYLRNMNVQTILQSIVREVLERGYETKGLDYLLLQTEEWLNREDAKVYLGSLAIQALEQIEWDGFLQFAMRQVLNMISEEKIGGILQNWLHNAVLDLRDPDSRNREQLLTKIRKELQGLTDSMHVRKELESWKNKWMDKWELLDPIHSAIQKALQSLTSFLSGPKFDQMFAAFLDKGIHTLRNDKATMQRMEQTLHTYIAQWVEENHGRIGQLVRENMEKLSDAELIALMEDKLGQDLQWIRVNGAICGWLIGLLIGAIKLWFHP
jgi:uncharacterized membrane-anchored protein YjiN (DUF445 family)